MDFGLGAGAHCQAKGPTVMQEVVYDWLDDTFGR